MVAIQTCLMALVGVAAAMTPIAAADTGATSCPPPAGPAATTCYRARAVMLEHAPGHYYAIMLQSARTVMLEYAPGHYYVTI